MSGLLVRKLQTYLPFPDADTAALRGLASEAFAITAKKDVTFRTGARHAIHQIGRGYACRYRQLPDGRRQILGFMIPGDFIDLRKLVLTGPGYTVHSLSPLSLLAYPVASFLNLLEIHPRAAQAVWRSVLCEESMAQEWLVSLGQRSALERVAHLLCELLVRHAVIGGSFEPSFALPVTQKELGDTMGLSTVHVNRTLRMLRERGLVRMQAGTVEVLDFPRLAGLALFTPDYLHFRAPMPETAAPRTASRAAVPAHQA